ncbi:MAG: sialate O-acetylesterase [Planctomycetaceae bacterium]|nr:sialate O-acetylesterase [Planctomycetaceae bacterium]
MRRIILAVGFLFLFNVSVHADVRLPSIIGSNMVLQQKLANPIWGWADAGEEVTVSTNGQTKSTKTGTDGKWSVVLDPQEVGGPFTLTIKGKNELTLENVMVGEVWLASGQSNMQWNVQNSTNSRNDIQQADFPNIRLITVPAVSKTTPQENFNGKWEPCTPKSVPNFSAVAFFFGRKLHQDLKIPVGLIHCSWGGSSCETWINPDVVAKIPEFAKMMERRVAAEKKQPAGGDNHTVGYLYNGMIRPVLGYGIRGVVWYQGEHNAGRAYQYRTLFPTLIQNWRDEWKQGDFPFYWVQLANFMATKNNPDNSAWAELREAQSKTRSLQNTGEAVIIDIGEAKDIHPRNKQDVGYRLAILALKQDYGKDIPHESPRYKSATFENGKATLKFDFAYDGLYSRGALPTGFAIAGEDKIFHWAVAEIIDKDTVVVSSPQVANPVAVRYGWADNPVVTLYNSAKLPLCPFRTDDWSGITVNNQ